MKDIHNINTWLPGTQMVFDSASGKSTDGNVRTTRFQAIGIVIANDGINTISVLWPEHCKNRFITYNVTSLNGKVHSMARSSVNSYSYRGEDQARKVTQPHQGRDHASWWTFCSHGS